MAEMTAKEAMNIGMSIADKYAHGVNEMAKAFPELTLAQLLAGNAVSLGAQIMCALQAASAPQAGESRGD